MDRFARIVLGYHGVKKGEGVDFARKLLLGEARTENWHPSQNEYDWLGNGIYFWEYSPDRAIRWAGDDGIVIGAAIQLGNCLDLTDIRSTELLQIAFENVSKAYADAGRVLPVNRGRELKLRELDCLVVNRLMDLPSASQTRIQTVRGAFEEGGEAFPGSMLKKETHIQVAVRDPECILGVFRPTGVSK